MTTLYLAQQGSTVSLHHEQLQIKKGKALLQTISLPVLEQILVFGQSHLTTGVIRACLRRNIPLAYLSRMGYCYGRLRSIQQGYRQLSRQQQQIPTPDQLSVAQAIVAQKLNNSRVLLLRQQRSHGLSSPAIALAIPSLQYLAEQAQQASTLQRLYGLEGTAASLYFQAWGECLRHPGFVFQTRTKRPPRNPVNALLSFGYQVLWNHLLTLIELQDLDPYWACLHQGHRQHPALASDLIEEFRAAIVDSLVLWLVNKHKVDPHRDFNYIDGACYLSDSGRKVFLQALVQRMQEPLPAINGQPRWDLLTRQVKAYKQFIYTPQLGYQPYAIR